MKKKINKKNNLIEIVHDSIHSFKKIKKTNLTTPPEFSPRKMVFSDAYQKHGASFQAHRMYLPFFNIW